MASPSIIDIEALTQPISEDRPQGEDLRGDRSPNSEYYAIKDARNSARAAERASMFDEDSSNDTLSQWKPIAELAPQILSTKSKDLEIASWYIEALVRLHGFAGLRDGLSLTGALVENFWDDLYPEPDEDGLETKVGPLTGLNGDGGEGTLLAPIRNVALTTQGSHGDFSYWQYQQAQDAAKISDDDKRAERVDTIGFTLEQISATVASGEVSFYVNLLDDLQQCTQVYADLNQQLRDHCGNDSPPSSAIKNLLDEILRAVRFLTKDRLAHLAASDDAPQVDTPDAAATGGGGPVAAAVAAGPIANREQALQRLQEVATYFRTYEPHTPLAATIERVVTWGRMTVSELMMELVPDDTARAIFTQLTGVKLDGSATESYVPPPVAAPASVATGEASTGGDTEWDESVTDTDNGGSSDSGW
ncbi:type VI secretion system protein TssA [Exilibacterium tricleocarpae]|uniref:Type VI secretion system protein TssA n=1 Tax=Exilibacterium tricleocarpae TaxID=2591008 RepID=A0A545SPM3_9GAMM|nr:type VI secretion system protein TssA [Exilibacterium tricleocarpae]TQV66911.1 type VI secretion system protein TssA [Exilibacterium tricleocarpae]